LKGLVLATAFSILLLAGIATNQSFGDNAHSQVLQWGSFGQIDGGHFFQLESLSIDNEGNVYVTDSGNARIQKFTSDGQFLKLGVLVVQTTENLKNQLELQLMKIMFML